MIRKLAIKFLEISLVLCFIFDLSAQSEFVPLKSDGIIPNDFIATPEEKYDAKIISVGENSSKAENKSKQEFYLNSIYLTDYLYQSGKVFFNSQLNNYLDKIVDCLLMDNIKLRNELKIYILDSEEINAFTINDGSIFINIGLLAKIENEAQLAFIFSHEIAHYSLNHILEGYIQNKKVLGEKENYKGLNYDQKRLIINNYSKEMELDADSVGFNQYFIKSGYTINAAEEALNLMLSSHLAYKEEYFQINCLERLSLLFPSNYQLTELLTESISSEYDDSNSTHPNIKKRIATIKNLSPESNKVKQDFLISQNEFRNLQKISRFELAHLYIQNQNYEQAIYTYFLLKNDYPGFAYYEKGIGIALFQIACYKNNNDYIEIHKSSNSLQGGLKQAAFLFEKLTPEEATVVAVNYLWHLRNKYHQDETIKELSELIIKELIFNFNETQNNSNDIETYTNLTLIALKKDNMFLEIYNNLLEERRLLLQEKEELIRNDKKRKEIAKQNKLVKKEGLALGIDKIVIVNPVSIITDYRKKNYFQWIASEKVKTTLINSLNENANEIHLEIKLLDIKILDSTNIAEYNDYAIASNWYSEKCLHSTDKYYQYEKKFINGLIQKYNTKYFAWAGIMTEAVDGFIPHKQSLIIFNLFNVESGELVLSQQEFTTGFHDTQIINQFIYKTLHQIKNKRD